MKKKISLERIITTLLVVIYIASNSAFVDARDIVKIEMKEGVSLKEALGEKYWTKADSLILVGKITEEDFMTLYDCVGSDKLKGIDMSKAETYLNSIPNNAFFEWGRPMPISGLGIEYITFPEKLEVIGREAFYMTHLKTVSFPETLNGFGDAAFCAANYLSGDLKIPSKVVTISESCFAGCSALKSVSFPEGLKVIEKEAFEDCNFDFIEFPKNLEVIESGAFRNSIKSKVYSLALTPPDVYGHGWRAAFYGCYDCTLYVPSEAIEAYKSTYPWSEFRQILPIGDKSGVEDISYESVSPGQAVYDLMGRKVTDLIPGQIYIRGGKKFVAE